MPRTVTGYMPGVEREYIPAAFGNRADQNPVTVWINSPTERDRYALTCFGDVIKIAKDKTDEYSINMAELFRRHCAAVERCVAKVANYTGAAGLPILTGADLATHGDPEIVAEVGEEILSNLSLKDEQIKKSKGSCASTLAATPALVGTAQSAGGVEAISLETVRAPTAANLTLPNTGYCFDGAPKAG